MAQITINIPDAIAPRVLNAFARKFGYSPKLDNGDDNPETKAQFAKRKLLETIKNAVLEIEVQDAKNNIATTTAQTVENEITLS